MNEVSVVSSVPESSRRNRTVSVRVTKLDRTTAQLIALCLFMGLVLLFLMTIWFSGLKPSRTLSAAPLVINDDDFGGDPDGAPGESLKIDSPEPPSADAQAGEDFTETAETPDAVPTDVVADVAVADLATDMLNQETSTDGDAPLVVRAFTPAPLTVRKPGSSQGTGTRRGLGEGKGTKGGVSRELRWQVKFADRVTLEEYAAQIDFFGIEMGALMPDGKLILVSKLAQAKPVTKTVTNGADEKRLYFTWKGGLRKAGDLELFQKAGVNASNAVMIMHFYPPVTENVLANIEQNYKNRKAIEIKRTYFVVRRAKDGYEFAVSSQTYLK
jgi:hypothetical protein